MNNLNAPYRGVFFIIKGSFFIVNLLISSKSLFPAGASLPNKNKFDNHKKTLTQKGLQAYAYILFQVCFV